jgi:MtN3 and saliva related transmembrane protein
MSMTMILGFVAAFCSTAAFVPQVIKTWRSRSTRDISRSMFATLVTGSLLWLVYAWLQGDLPIFATNAIIFVLGSSILALKIRHG